MATATPTKYEHVEIQFLSVTEAGARVVKIERIDRGDEMVLDTPDYDGTPFYVAKGIRRGHHYRGAHSVFGDETRITATWTALDDRYVGVWVENGREWFFTFSLVSE